MAEAFLEILLKNLSSLIQGEIGLIMGVDEEMKKLASTLTTIQAVIEDAEEKQLQNKAIRNWLCKLNDVAYEVDDILDECATNVSKLKHKNSKLSCYSLKKILLGYKTARRIKQVTKELDAVAAERAKFHLREMAIERPREVIATRETGSILNDSHHVYGREEDKDKIVDILLNHTRENQEISVLPIVGLGGLGKTTVAQLIFNDQRVVEHFEKRLWVCVSDNFDVKTLVKSIIESATKSANESKSQHLETLQWHLWKLLSQKRYLLVLDGVWSDHQEKWFELRNVLACGSTGASIIVTTRLKKVADIMGTLPTYYLMGLSEKHCWMLLKQRAFGEKEEEYPNLEVIGKQIVKKCAGVPMVAKAIGGILRFKRTELEWIYVKESEIWNLPEDEALILPVLRLSYCHLPLAPRQCFAYCAVFPKGYKIQKKELIFHWMARGLISSNGIVEVEDVGYEICNELVLRSLLQVWGSDAFIMHDLVRDLARSIRKNKVSETQVKRNVTSNSKIRRVTIENITFPTSTEHDVDMSSILMKFSHLRVLDGGWIKIKHLPSAVSNLKHLRYLNLSLSRFHTLPDSLCRLWNLQILNLDYCIELVALPKNMRYLVNLRHLCLESCTSLSEMPTKIRELTCLKTLGLFIVGRNKGNQLEELQCLNLGGKLEIKHLERVENHIDAKKANLSEKKNLCDLSLVWQRKSASKLGEDQDIDDKVLEALEPHPNIETLSIIGFRGRCFPVWMTKSTLQNIVWITIKDCHNFLRLPQLGELSHLKFLWLENLHSVEYIIEDEVQGGNSTNIQFPSLETLFLWRLPNLKGLAKEQATREVFPNLLELDIWNCCSSLILPPLSSLKKLWAVDCSSLTLASLSKLDNLTSLIVGIKKNMDITPNAMRENITNLKTSKVSQAPEHHVLEDVLRANKTLRKLRIANSNTVTCLPEAWLRHLTALEEMYVSSCPEFVELSEEIKYLHQLKSLQLADLPEMVQLPKSLQYLSSLKNLVLESLAELNTLPDWLDHLTSLDFLCLIECQKLVSLPASVGKMPNLRVLLVIGCQELERRYGRKKGQDWHKISHIPYPIIIPQQKT